MLDYVQGEPGVSGNFQSLWHGACSWKPGAGGWVAGGSGEEAARDKIDEIETNYGSHLSVSRVAL